MFGKQFLCHFRHQRKSLARVRTLPLCPVPHVCRRLRFDPPELGNKAAARVPRNPQGPARSRPCLQEGLSDAFRATTPGSRNVALPPCPRQSRRLLPTREPIITPLWLFDPIPELPEGKPSLRSLRTAKPLPDGPDAVSHYNAKCHIRSPIRGRVESVPHQENRNHESDTRARLGSSA